MTLGSGVTVSGSIDAASFEPPVNVQRLRVLLEPIETASDWEMTRYEDAPEPDGTFRIRGVPPGRYRVDVAGLPAGWALDSAVFGGRNAADVHLLVERGENIGAGLAEADLENRRDRRRGDDDRRRARAGSHRRRVSGRSVAPPAASRGASTWCSRLPTAVTRSAGFPPGEYRIAVVDGVEAGQQFDSAFLAQLDADAVSATVTAGRPLRSSFAFDDCTPLDSLGERRDDT